MTLVTSLTTGLVTGITNNGLLPPNPEPSGGTVRQQLLALAPALALVPADGDKTYSSGALVSSIVDEAGVTWTADATKEPTYTAPSLVGADTTTNIRAPFTASGNLTIVLYFYIPASVPSNIQVLSIGTSATTGNATASILINTTGTITWAQQSGGGFPVLSATDRRGTWNLLTLKFNNGGVCDAYLNENPVVTFTPNSGYATGSYLHLFSRQPSFSSIANMEFGDVFLFRQVINTPSQASMLSFYQSIYG